MQDGIELIRHFHHRRMPAFVDKMQFAVWYQFVELFGHKGRCNGVIIPPYQQRIMTDLKAAMVAKDEAALRSLRAIKAAILLAKTAEGASGELKEEDEVKLLQKLVKSRKDSLEIFQQQNRPELAKKEEEEIAVIEKFLPRQLSADELKAELEKIIAATGASSPADMGKVMGVATKQLAGKADGKMISSLVKELLAR